MKSLSFIFLLFVLCFNVSFANESYCPKNVQVLWEEWEPYTYKNSSGEMDGIDYRIIKAVLNEINCPFTTSNCPWKRCLLKIEHGSGTILNGVTPTEERGKYGYFSESFRNETVGMVGLEGFGKKYTINDYSDVIKHKLKVGYARGSVFGDDFETFRKNPKNKIVELGGELNQHFKMLQKKRIDLTVRDIDAARVSAKKNKVRVEIVKETQKTPVTFLLSKKAVDTPFLDKVNEAIKKFKANGKIDSIVKEYWEQYNKK